MLVTPRYKTANKYTEKHSEVKQGRQCAHNVTLRRGRE